MAHKCNPIKVKNVIELANETKNSVRLTEPIVYFAFLPPAINVEETIGPQPPPPIESKNPPTMARGKMRFIFSLTLSFFNALKIIINPSINV